MSKELVLIGGAKGGGGGAPPPPVVQPKSLRSVAYGEVLDLICEGSIRGFATTDPMESVYLDDTALKKDGVLNFQGATLDYRLGTQDQTYIPGYIEDSSATAIAVDVMITHATPVTRTITDALMDAIRVNVQVDRLETVNSTTGDQTANSVELRIEVRPLGGSWQTALLNGREIITGVARSPYQRDYTIPFSQFSGSNVDSYDVRVVRVSPDDTPGHSSVIRWSSYTKLNYNKLRYPNSVVIRTVFNAQYFSSLPKRGFLLYGKNDLKIPTPDVYDPINRVYTGADWSGNFTTGWTRNPAWVYYDLATNPRYGLGEYVNPAYMDKWNLYKIAQRCDERVPDGKGGTEPRYSLDLYLQQENDAKKVLMDIASAFDCMCYWGAGGILATQDAPKSVSTLYVPGNVVGGRFVYAGAARQVRYTAAYVQWNDPDDQYRIATEYVEDVEGIARYGFQEKTIAAIGCTSRGQAHRLGKRILLTSRLETETVSFSVGLDGMTCKPGDIIRVADPVKSAQKRYGGRLLPGCTTTSILLDAPVELVAGKSYRVAVINADGDVVDKPITTVASTTDTLTVSPGFSAAPDSDLPFIVYDPNESGRLFRILNTIENTDKTSGPYSITAVQYSPEKYAAIDDLAELPPLPDNPFRNQAVQAPSGLTVSTGTYFSLEGMTRFLDITWSPSNDRYLSNYVLSYIVNGQRVNIPPTNEVTYRILNPLVGDYVIELYAVSVIGSRSSTISVNYTLDEIYAINSVSVIGLSIKGGGTTFAGNSIELVWGDDSDSVLGSSSYGTGAGGSKPWFRDFQINVYDGPAYALAVANNTLGSLAKLRSDYVTEHAYNYTFARNLQDGGPRRNVAFVVRARDDFGRYSHAAAVQVSNPLPAAVLASGVTINPGYQSAIISYQRPADNDWVGVIVFMGSTSGFTPDRVTNQIYIGSDQSIVVTGLAVDTQYYFRIASYDAFYDISATSSTDYTLTSTVFTATITSVADAPSPQAIKDGLQTALNTATNPLVFNADVFAVKINGVDKPPFVVGQIDGSPAILLDADVGVLGTLSATQLRSGTLGVSQLIEIGNGNAAINGDGSMLVYNGPKTQANRDFALLNGGTLTFQRYRNGAYHEYKSVKRVEHGQANSGSTVTLPGYWDSQPNIIVSPAALQSYNAANVESSQTWTVRAQNLHEYPTGSGIWQFDAIAELNYSAASGERVVSSSSGASASESWTSAESVLPTNTVSITATARFSSVKGNGSSTYGYYYRSVTWYVQGWNGSVWTNIGTKTRNITAAEHGALITDTLAVNTTGYTIVRLVITSYNTNGSVYSLGGNTYNYSEHITNGSAYSGSLSSGSPLISGSIDTGVYTGADEVYAFVVNVNWGHTSLGFNDPDNGYFPGSSLLQITGYGSGVSNHLDTVNGTASSSGSYSAPIIYTNTYNRNLLSFVFKYDGYWDQFGTYYPPEVVQASQAGGNFSINNVSATLYLRSVQLNSTTPASQYQFQSYAWSISGSTAITTGSLNWQATGD